MIKDVEAWHVFDSLVHIKMATARAQFFSVIGGSMGEWCQTLRQAYV
jgi:hypothetical protein